MLSQRRGVFTLHPSLSLTAGFYDTRASRRWREVVGGVWVSSLELTEAVTILTTNHFHSRLSFVRSFHLRISPLLPKLHPVVA